MEVSDIQAYEKEDVMDKKTSFPPTDLKRRNYYFNKEE
jgi:hypothetical protein